MLLGGGVPFYVDVRGPIPRDMGDETFAALVEGRVVVGGGADCGGVEVVEGGWERGQAC